MELLPHHVIEDIMERLDVKTLLKFKSVSKQWESTIQSPYFQKRQLSRQSGGDPYVLLVSVLDPYVLSAKIEALRTLVVGSSSVSVQIPTTWENELYQVCNTSCDGLVCLYDFFNIPSIVVNPTTRWYQTFPPCNWQLVAAERLKTEDNEVIGVPVPYPGFGKDKINGTYKQVWLYNSAQLGLNKDATTCEVFDFGTNVWRYVAPASPHLILHTDPVYFDGSLHWFTASSHEGETMVLSFDGFQVISKAPFLHASDEKIGMCNLDDRLFIYEEKCPDQIIWSFDSDDKTWKKIYSLDLNITYSLFAKHILPLTPLAVLDKDKLLFYDRESGDSLVTHDPKSKSYDVAYTSKDSAYVVCYSPSLISIL